MTFPSSSRVAESVVPQTISGLNGQILSRGPIDARLQPGRACGNDNGNGQTTGVTYRCFLTTMKAESSRFPFTQNATYIDQRRRLERKLSGTRVD